MDSPMQGRTDEARGRFTSQHAHVVRGRGACCEKEGQQKQSQAAAKQPSSQASRQGTQHRAQHGQLMKTPLLAVLLVVGSTAQAGRPLPPEQRPALVSSRRWTAQRRKESRANWHTTCKDRQAHAQSIASFVHSTAEKVLFLAPHTLIHPKIQDQGQCGGVPYPLVPVSTDATGPLWHLLLGQRVMCPQPLPDRPSDIECLPFSFLMREPGVIFALASRPLCFSLRPRPPSVCYSLLEDSPSYSFRPFFPFSQISHTTHTHTHSSPARLLNITLPRHLSFVTRHSSLVPRHSSSPTMSVANGAASSA